MNHRYDLYRGREVNGQLVGLKVSGFAFQNDGEEFYRIRLFLFPETTFYMSRNQGSGYTIFSRFTVSESGKVVFQNPVGWAKLLETVRTHLYVRFPDLGSHMFMSLFPSGKESEAS